MLIKTKEEKRKEIELDQIKIEDFINIETLISQLNKKENGQIRNIKYIKIHNLYNASKSFNIKFLEILKRENKNISEKYNKYLKNELNNITLIELVSFILLELEIIINLFKENYISIEELNNLLFELSFIDNPNKLKEKWKNGTSKDKNTNLLETNKYAYELPKDYSKMRNIPLKNQIYKLNLPLVEIPGDKEDKNMLDFFIKLENLIKVLDLKKTNFNLRIRKVKKQGKEGMFIVNANTIILDPRYPETIVHELGHYIYEHKLSFTHSKKRFYASTFDKIIKSHYKKSNIDFNKKNELEDYSDESEVFAYWFESIVKL